jgi:hypothetical protein
MIRNTSTHNSGQLLILGGITFAILLLSLAFVLNTLIYSQNASVRGSNLAEYSTSTYVSELNRVESDHLESLAIKQDQSYSQLQTSYTDRSTQSRQLLDRDLARRGILSNTQLSNTTNGTHIYQTDYQPLTGADGSINWELVTLYNEYNKLKFVFDRSTLLSINSFAPINSDFYLRLDNSSPGSYVGNIYIYQNTSNTTTTVEFYDDSNVLVESCSVPSQPDVSIDFAKYSVNNELCPALKPIDNADSLQIREGNDVQGKYIYKGAGEKNTITNSMYYYEDTSNQYPQRSRILYSSKIQVDYAGKKTSQDHTQTIKIGDVYDIED